MIAKTGRFLVVALIGLLLGALPAPAGPDRSPLDLESYLLKVLETNPSIRADRLKAQALREDARLTVANQRTNVSVAGSVERWTYYPGRRSDQTLSLVLRQNVDVSGLYGATERKALYAYRIGLYDYAATINAVLAAAEEAYWKAGYARKKVILLEEIVEERLKALDLLELQLRQKLVTAIDRNKGRVNLEEGQLALEEARSAELLALEDMARYVGLSGFCPAEVPEDAFGLPGDLATVLEANPQLASARTAVDYARAGLAVAARGRAPTVQLQGTYRLWTDYTSPYSDLEEGEWDLLLYVDFPLVDGGKVAADVRKNRNLVDEAIQRLRDGEDEVTLLYRQASQEWHSAMRKAELLKRQQRYAGENRESTWILFQERLKDTLALMDAFEKDQQAKTQLVEALLNIRLAEVKARKALGAYLDDVPRDVLEGGGLP